MSKITEDDVIEACGKINDSDAADLAAEVALSVAHIWSAPEIVCSYLRNRDESIKDKAIEYVFNCCFSDKSRRSQSYKAACSSALAVTNDDSAAKQKLLFSIMSAVSVMGNNKPWPGVLEVPLAAAMCSEFVSWIKEREE